MNFKTILKHNHLNEILMQKIKLNVYVYYKRTYYFRNIEIKIS